MEGAGAAGALHQGQATRARPQLSTWEKHLVPPSSQQLHHKPERWKPPRCPLTSPQVKKMWCLRTVDMPTAREGTESDPCYNTDEPRKHAEREKVGAKDKCGESTPRRYLD